MSAGGFGAAIGALKRGEFVKRTAWGNGFVFLAHPESLNDANITDDRLTKLLALRQEGALAYSPCFCFFQESTGAVHRGWVPTQLDMLAQDWAHYTYEDALETRMTQELCRAMQEGMAASMMLTLMATHFKQRGIACELPDDRPVLILEAPFDYAQVSPVAGLHGTDGQTIYHVTGMKDGVHTNMKTVNGTGDIIGDLIKLGEKLGIDRCSKRTFHRTLIQLDVLSEDDIPPEMGVDAIILEMEEGDFVGKWSTLDTAELDALQTVQALDAVGSDASFFNLTQDGKDADDG